MSRKIKIFLGGYVNYQAAQNINCRSLSKHLDKERFEVYTILYPYPNTTDFIEEKDVHYIKMNRHLRSLGWIAVIRGVIKCDVLYWTKWEYSTFARLTAKIMRKKIFKTVEGILADSDLAKVKNPQRYLNANRDAEPNLYAITRYIKDRVGRAHDFKFAKRILYLGVEAEIFFNPNNNKRTGKLNNIVFIGNNLVNKGIVDFFNMARFFPETNFYIVGADTLWNGTLEEYINTNNCQNVHYQGKLNHTDLSVFLRQMDLMFFPSRAEGFPKVQLETACAGVPTLCYADYGASEWITSGVNGFVVNTYDEALAVIKRLKDNSEEMKNLSKGAVELGRRFDWNNLISIWETEIERIYTTN